MIILKSLRFFSGFVRVKASGVYNERIINICFKNGITIWSIKKKEQDLFFNISTKDFKRLHILRNKCGISIKIHYKIGFPFVMNKHKKRAGLLIGLIIFFACLYTLSSFVWNVKVSGNVNITTKEIMSAAKEVGIYEGMLKSKINSPKMRNLMLYKFDKLSWVSFNLEGSLLTINVSETKPKAENQDKTPTNLVATKDGVIKYLEIKSGYSAVKIGQAVKKGELLVSGATEFKEGVASFFRSNGSVLAETEVIFEDYIPLKQEIYVKTGKSSTRRVLQFFGLNIPLYFGAVNGEYNKQITEEFIKTENNYLPIKLITANYEELKKQSITLSLEEAESQLKAKADAALNTEKIKEVLSINDEFTVLEDCVKIKRTAKVLEDITEAKVIQINSLS